MGYNFDEGAGVTMMVILGSVIYIPMTMFGGRVADWIMMAIVFAGLELGELFRQFGPEGAKTVTIE